MSRISQLLTLGLVTAGVTWLAKSRNMASNPSYAMGRDTVRKHQTTSGTTNRSMRGSSMKSDMEDSRGVTHSYSPAHSASHSSGTEGSSSVYDNPLATGSATGHTPGTYGPGSSSRQ